MTELELLPESENDLFQKEWQERQQNINAELTQGKTTEAARLTTLAILWYLEQKIDPHDLQTINELYKRSLINREASNVVGETIHSKIVGINIEPSATRSGNIAMDAEKSKPIFIPNEHLMRERQEEARANAGKGTRDTS